MLKLKSVREDASGIRNEMKLKLDDGRIVVIMLRVVLRTNLTPEC